MRAGAEKIYRAFVWLLLVTLVIRLFSLGLYPLMDTTEARYAEMARMMLVNGDWVTPYIEPDVPFWGKPPLQNWVSAASFAILGINEFAARFPHFLAGLLVLALIRYIACRRYEQGQVLAAMTILATTAVFMMSIGAVMTDTLLTLSITLSLVSAWNAISEHDEKWGYGFFIGLGIGMLAKGPVAVVLVGATLLPWCLIGKQWSRLFCNLPWFGGTLLSLAVSLPWFILAETKTPGFLEYFFIGEHWLRFTVSGWEGDLYGEAHAEPRGTIWLYALLGGFPWSLILIYLVGHERFGGKNMAADPKIKNWRLFLWCWVLAPLLLFSPAANILPAYFLPGTPALALLVVEYAHAPMRRTVLIASGLTPLLFCVILGILCSGRVAPKADKHLLRNWEPGSNPPIYWQELSYSARFYSGGTAIRVTNVAELAEQLGDGGSVVLPQNTTMPGSISSLFNCRQIGENQKRRMFSCTKIPPPENHSNNGRK